MALVEMSLLAGSLCSRLFKGQQIYSPETSSELVTSLSFHSLCPLTHSLSSDWSSVVFVSVVSNSSFLALYHQKSDVTDVCLKTVDLYSGSHLIPGVVSQIKYDAFVNLICFFKSYTKRFNSIRGRNSGLHILSLTSGVP